MGELLLLLLGPIVTASVTATSVWLRETQQRRDREHRRRRAIEQATQELTLIGSWLSAQERLRAIDLSSVLTERISQDLEKAYSVLAVPVLAEPIVAEPLRSRWRISTFLLRDAQRGWAKVVRFFYYLFLIVATVWSVASFAILGEMGTTFGNVLTSVLLAMFGVLPALGTYKLVRQIDRGRQKETEYRIGVDG